MKTSRVFLSSCFTSTLVDLLGPRFVFHIAPLSVCVGGV